jgi:ATP-dependent DNA helicase PIF1
MKFKGKTLDEEKIKIIRDIELGNNCFITGNAGTGKSFLVEYIAENFKEGLIVTATTGVAAINISGITIAKMTNRYNGVITPDELVHELETKPFLRNKAARMRNCKMLIIDEVSMLHRKDMEYFDKVWRGVRGISSKPFGGVQIVMVGDFLQLPPVVKGRELCRDDYAFSSWTWDQLKMKKHCLTQVYRTDDAAFTKILDNVRTGKIKHTGNGAQLDKLIDRSVESEDDIPEHFRDKVVRIFSTNSERDIRNKIELSKVTGSVMTYVSQPFPGKEKEAAKMIKDLPSEDPLRLKVGARVMLLCNDYFENNLANGSTGKVISLEIAGVWVAFDNGLDLFIKEKTYSITTNPSGGGASTSKNIFKRIPLTLAWAITAHKSQGLSISFLFCGFKGFFAPGQAYVALSRATKIDQLWIKDFSPTMIKTCSHALEFHTHLRKTITNDNTF